MSSGQSGMLDRSARTGDSTLDAIGSTPLVELGRLTRDLSGRLLAKLEYLNPGHSKKDRIARQIIEDAEDAYAAGAEGALRPGQPVVEMTSGNTGTGLAIVCAVKGYPFVAVMSKGNSHERARMMAALGAEVVVVEQLPESKPGQVSGGDLELVDARTREIVAERGAFHADQFSLAGNFRAHYLHTGPEILAQTRGELAAFCDFAGTGGTIAGCAAAFKETDPSIRCYAVEPAGARALAGAEVVDPCHRIQGGGYSRAELPLLRRDQIDGFLSVCDEEARLCARELGRCEGIFAGYSSGANVAAALELLGGPHRGETVVTLICDSGLKYLSTDLWRGLD